MSVTILTGDAIETLRTLQDATVQCCVTSPPYWNLRDYGMPGQYGLEKTPQEYVARMVDVFREVRRVLKGDGTLWLNIGDGYAQSGMGGNPEDSPHRKQATNAGSLIAGRRAPEGLKPKDLLGMPWRVAFALQADGWYLRQEIIWHKPNPMPESVTDRCTKAHEQVFLLAKSERYYYDAKAICEASVDKESLRPEGRNQRGDDKFAKAELDEDRNGLARTRSGFANLTGKCYPTRNRRSVWTIPTQPCAAAHFAVMPEALVLPCIMAGSRIADTVLDPFGGSGTVGKVAEENGRNSVLIELNPEYVELARQRTAQRGLLCAEASR